VSIDGFETPEEAARGDIPARFARALATAISPDQSTAVVILGTNEEPFLYPYEVICYRKEGRWFEGSGSNGIGVGWTTTSGGDRGEMQLGVLRLVGEAPEGVRAVVVGYKSEEHRVPVLMNGFFIFAAWDVPDDYEPPEALRYVLSDGSESPVPADKHGVAPEMRARVREHHRQRRDKRIWGEGVVGIESVPDDDS
jgi:hypothetical protein